MKLNKLYSGVLCGLMSVPAVSFAQGFGEELVEEIVVTGSYIRRDKFDMASPVETIDAGDMQKSGYSNIGSYIRDLTYTANVDTVANVLSVADGQQDSNSARFNLRGLGTSSTLTLMDGRRVIDSGAVAAILPDIALDRVEVILDGGAATYGTDAVAGVVNLVPIQSYEGFKLRGFYTQDADGDTNEPKLSGLWGKSFDSLELVAAFEYSERADALYRSDRPEFLRADNDTSSSGNPGTWNPIFTAGIDPECGDPDANAGKTDDGQAGSFPAGFPDSVGIPICTFEFGQFQDYKRPYEELKAFFSGFYEVNDYLSLQGLFSYNDRTSTVVSTPSTAERGSNDLLTVPAAHPNNPFGMDVTPRSWRPFASNGATQPSSLDSHGSSNSDHNYVTTSLSLGAEFDLGDSGWYGEAWFTTAQLDREVTGTYINLDRMAMALQGNGGPGGDQWFNPFFSASVFSPTYDGCEVELGTTCTANSQQLVDWINQKVSFAFEETDYTSVESFVTGDIAELPAGPMELAVGVQFRKTEFATQGNPLSRTPSTLFTDVSNDNGPASQDYNAAVVNGVGTPSSNESAVSSLFMELLVPFTDSFDLTFAARYEDFKDLNVSTTVPKVSVRYQPHEDVSLRASFGEGFLAPDVDDTIVNETPTCQELLSGSDPALAATAPAAASLTGALSCSNGNSELQPEESTIFNFGGTWRATDDLELSMDYQQIEYTDRIVLLSSTDTLRLDFANFLSANGLDEGDFDGTDPADLAALAAWTNANGLAIRNPTTGRVQQTLRRPGNVAKVDIELIDFRASYSVDFGNAGLFSTRWSTTAYTKYEYQDAFGETRDAAGKQNGQTDIAPPIPKLKNQLRFSWLVKNHFIGLAFNHQSAVDFDAPVGPAFGPDPKTADDAPDEIDAQTIVDFRYAYTFNNLSGGQLELALGSNNLFDESPQALPIEGGLETRLQDPLGRTFFIEGTYTFE